MVMDTRTVESERLLVEVVLLGISPVGAAHRADKLLRSVRSSFADRAVTTAAFLDAHIESSARSFRSMTNSTLIIYLLQRLDSG